jgi:uracil-DNA glycosylase family 4
MPPIDMHQAAPGAAPLATIGVEALLGFWVEAGVDVCLSETPVDRLAEGARKLASAPRPAYSAQSAASSAPAPAAPIDEPSDIAAAIMAAKVAAAAASNLADLEAAIAAFDGCPLRRQGARNTVFARGNPTAPVMIIGEGPGAEEDAQGKPFVGRAGKLLDRMLAAAGLSDRIFITNTVFWRPPGNRTPTPDEQAICAPFLEQAIRLVGPKLLLLSGGVSAKSLLKRQDGILSLRGQWLDWTSQDGESVIPALPTLHPAFLLRQPAAKAQAWKDLLTLLSRLDRVL